jgi:methionyl-tRNA formyltransferase
MPRIAFFGTPELARTCLAALLARPDPSVVLVVCQPDRPQGRGQKLQAPPVKQLALEHGLPVLQPLTLKRDTDEGEAFFRAFVDAHVDLAIVAAYGRILPQRLLDVPPRCFVNVHASLLPRWRGAAPIQRAIEAGDTETGVCLMHMVKGLDEGDVYARGTVAIDDSDDGETLQHKVATLGGKMLQEHLPALLAGTLPRTPQGADGVTYASMLKKDDGRVDFHEDARAVSCHARGMTPWPGAFTTLGGEVLKLFAPTTMAGDGAPGTVLSTSDGLLVACGSGAVRFDAAQLPNKKRMPIAELIKGHPIATGTTLGAGVGEVAS